jgi:hypothetical protein
VLGPVGALRELEAICEGMLAGRGGPAAANRPSLVSDLSLALRKLGPRTTASAGKTLTSFQAELSRIKERLETPQGARVIALSLAVLFDKLAEELVVAAAWWDTVDAFTDDEVAAETCELRVAQLVELVENRGVDFSRWTNLAEGLLGDDARTLKWAGEDVLVDDETGLQFGGIDEQRRLELCAQTLAELPSRARFAVWLLIDNAALSDAFQSVGPIWLFDSRFWPDAVRSGEAAKRVGQNLPVPPELADWDEAKLALGWDADTQMFRGVDLQSPRLLARVWVESTTVAGATDQARTVVQGMVDLATPDSGWLLLDGYATWREGLGWSHQGFRDPRAAAAAHVRHPAHDRTASKLEDLDAQFMERWLRAEPAALEAVDDALWTVAVERAPSPSHRIMLAIRAVERTLGQARQKRSDSWAEAASRYLRGSWVDFTLANEVLDAGFCAVNGLPDKSGANADLNHSLHALMFPPSDSPGTMAAFVRGFAALGDDVVAALLEGSMEHRIVREAIAVLTSSESALKRLAGLGTCFDRLLERTERQRNALTHGTGTTRTVVAGVDAFVVVLAQYMAQETLRRAATGKEPLIEFERSRVRALEQQARLEVGESPLSVLWPD